MAGCTRISLSLLSDVLRRVLFGSFVSSVLELGQVSLHCCLSRFSGLTTKFENLTQTMLPAVRLSVCLPAGSLIFSFKLELETGTPTETVSWSGSEPKSVSRPSSLSSSRLRAWAYLINLFPAILSFGSVSTSFAFEVFRN